MIGSPSSPICQPQGELFKDKDRVFILHIPGPSTVPTQSGCSVTICWISEWMNGKQVHVDQWNWLLSTGLAKLPFCCVSFLYLSFYVRETNREFSTGRLDLWVMWTIWKGILYWNFFFSVKTDHPWDKTPGLVVICWPHSLHIYKVWHFIYVISCTFVMLVYLTHPVS